MFHGLFWFWINDEHKDGVMRVTERKQKMKKRVFSGALLVFLGMHVGCALAQGAGDFDNELTAFKNKIAAAKAGHAGNVQNADAAPIAKENGAVKPETSVKAATPNPLGLAAELPVKGRPPATANALGIASSASPADLQTQMDTEAQDQQKKMEQQTFEAALKQLLPLSPEQIRATYDKFEESRKAAETPIKIPENRTRVETITLDPGQVPPVIHMVPGYVTTLSVLDSSGAPWPVQDMSYAGEFDVTPPETGGNVVRMTPQSTHGVGNMSMRLVDLITPVIFTLTTSLDQVDYRFEARVAKTGPLAKTPIIEFGGGVNAVAGTDLNLVSVLDGTIPAGAEKLRVSGVDARTTAWRVSGKVYLRTPHSLLSPAWNSSVASSDGTTVYTLNDTPVILLSDEGRMVRAHVAAVDEGTP
jgi:intracellular multiplication protein IcmK